MDIQAILKEKFLFFDGAMGSMLLKKGLKTGEVPEIYNITQPEIIKGIHQSYIEAGADIITTNTFQANELKLKHTPYTVEDVIKAGVKNGKEAGAKYVALDIGPLGQLMEPLGPISFEEAYDIFARQVTAGVEAGADLILIETLTDLYEAKASVLAAKENSNLPVICTMTFEKDHKTFFRADPLTVTQVLQALGVDALGVNCSLGPKELLPIVEEILKYAQIPVIAQPNAGLPRVEGKETVYDINAKEFATYVKEMALKGVAIFGGCCGTTPEHIKVVKEAIRDLKPIETRALKLTCACSGRNTIILEDENIKIEETVSPAKKELREALAEGNLKPVLLEVKKQQKAGARIISINVAYPEVNQKVILKELVLRLQKTIHLPLEIITSDLDAVEGALRIFNGKPFLTFVKDSEEIFKNGDKLLQIANKYGATVRVI